MLTELYCHILYSPYYLFSRPLNLHSCHATDELFANFVRTVPYGTRARKYNKNLTVSEILR